MGRKLDPSRKEKRGPGRKARKQRGAEVELARFLPPAKGKKSISKGTGVELSSDGEVEEGSWEMEEEGEDGSSEELMDDYGASSSEEEELLPIEKAALKQKADDGDLSEDDSEEEKEAEETSRQKMGQKEKEDTDLQLNLEIDEEFKLPTDEQIEKEDILKPYAGSSVEPEPN
ncbi:hypothetical protein ASZ78_000787 [Callipepla squamata]|uniref:Uncharacterized protein n=1 Tax=Callipepla squamata TaxID=9009 RepID=A0A226MYT1_CALSU|nr:hypothetical protein ASZ78_000787 [Callipepla squamata]